MKTDPVPFQFDYGQSILNYLEWRALHKDEMNCPDAAEAMIEILKITDKYMYKLPLYVWPYHQGIDESILEKWFTQQEITNIDESGDPAKKTGLRSQGYVGLYNILITRVAERNYKKMMDEIDTYITSTHTGRASQQAVLLADVIQRAIFLPETIQNTYMPKSYPQFIEFVTLWASICDWKRFDTVPTSESVKWGNTKRPLDTIRLPFRHRNPILIYLGPGMSLPSID